MIRIAVLGLFVIAVFLHALLRRASSDPDLGLTVAAARWALSVDALRPAADFISP